MCDPLARASPPDKLPCKMGMKTTVFDDFQFFTVLVFSIKIDGFGFDFQKISFSGIVEAS